MFEEKREKMAESSPTWQWTLPYFTTSAIRRNGRIKKASRKFTLTPHTGEQNLVRVLEMNPIRSLFPFYGGREERIRRSR